MTTHTPGPWRAEPRDSGGLSIMAKGDVVAQTNRYGQTLPDVEANARLIAAAPDLLAALREIDTIVNESAGECRKRMGTRLGNIMVAARAAIAKAEGMS